MIYLVEFSPRYTTKRIIGCFWNEVEMRRMVKDLYVMGSTVHNFGAIELLKKVQS